MHKKNKFIFSFLLFLICFIIFGINFFQIINSNKNFSNLIYKFTSESNITILIVMFLFFTPFRKNLKFSYLAFIALVSILFTSFINYTILDREEIKKFSFQQTIHYRHTIIPFLYTIFYFSTKDIKNLISRHVYVGLIHPLFYFIFFFIKGLFVKNAKYPYDFIDHNKKGIFRIEKGQGYLYLILVVFILAIFLYIFSYFLNFLKKKISK